MIKSPAALIAWDDDGDPFLVVADTPTHVEIPSMRTASPIVESSSLGYKRPMVTEVRIAPRWGNAVSDYVRYLRAADQSPDTIYLRGYQLRTLSQAFRGRSPWELTTDDLAGFLASLQTANSTKRSMLVAIRGFYRYGHNTGKIVGNVNPAAPLKSIEATKGVPRPAPIEDVQSAVQRADERTRLMIYLGVYAGLRRAEIAAVSTRDLVRERDGFSLRVVGKGRKTRVVPIPDRLAALIQLSPEGWLFPSWHRGQIGSDGSRFDQHLSPIRVGELVRAALPKGVTCHMLRHRFATNSFARERDLIAVSELLGHSSVATTQNYVAAPDDAKRRAVNDAFDIMGM